MKRIFWLLPLAALATAGSGQPVQAQKSRDGENRWVEVVNDRSSDMMRLYWSSTKASDWEGRNILARPIPAGAKMRLNFDDGTGACYFDFRAIFRDKLAVHMWRIDVCTESYWRVTD